MALSLGRIIIELTALVGPRGNQLWDWIASGSNVPIFDAGSPVWWIGRGVIVLMLLATAASVIGLWRYRTWGWSLALILAGLILAVDIGVVDRGPAALPRHVLQHDRGLLPQPARRPRDLPAELALRWPP